MVRLFTDLDFLNMVLTEGNSYWLRKEKTKTIERLGDGGSAEGYPELQVALECSFEINFGLPSGE